jgi:hypothetical protein
MTVRKTARVVALVTALLATLDDFEAEAAHKAKCRSGTVPVVTGSGHKLKVVRAHGKVRCRKPGRPSASKVVRPSASAQQQVAAVADQFPRALEVRPDAFGKIDRRIGSRRRKALVSMALKSWRDKVGARAHAADNSGELHVNETFGSGKTTGTVKLDAVPSGDDKLGLKATATVDIESSEEALKDLAPDTLRDAKSAKIKLEVTFEDTPAACPTAAGKVSGKLRGAVKVTLTAQGSSGSASQFASADVTATYNLTVGEDARWQTIDDVEVNTQFAYGGAKQGTETWRGRRFGDGFDEHGIFGSGSTSIEKQYTHIDATKGGIFGPHGRVRYDTGPTAWDIQSISNLRGLLITQVATDYLMFAAMEYVRAIVVPRQQRHWYDDEACLKFDASPAASRLRAGETTPVTAQHGRAADGAPAKMSLTATGVASLTPATADVPASASKAFTLTAPSANPVVATWQLVALSRAGKKTLSGTVGDNAGYKVTLSSNEVATFATHDSTATMSGAFVATPLPGAATPTWTGSTAVVWSDITFTSKVPCTFIDPVSSGTWGVTITQLPGDTISVGVDFDAATMVLATIVCPPGSVIPGEPGPRPVGLEPLSFVLPATGGSQSLGGSFTDGGDGFTHSGSIVVEQVAG